MRYLLLLFFISVGLPVLAQTIKDTVNRKELKEVIIRSWQRRDISHTPEGADGMTLAGKKTEVINIAAANANVAVKTARQLFSKIPGVFVYDMDGSGNQLNIATRGLDPHRSWEYNIRQNGVLVNSDMYGYPASHYSAPIESYDKIEMVRGTGSLQYGAQFGGMINYTTKKPDSTKLLSFESINTIGSYNLFNTYNAISGTHKKFSYYAYYQKRHSRGYRTNSNSDATAQFIQLNYKPSKNLLLKAEFGRSAYLYQLPGQLTDSMFYANPRMATRSRNYFNPDIYIPSVTMQWKISSGTFLSVIGSGVFGARNSVLFDAFANVPDTINRVTGQYKNRQVDIDRFNSKTLEARLIHQYQLGKLHAKLATGFVYMNNNLHRRQLGKGTTGTDYDLSLTTPGFGRNIHFKTKNIALFAENNFFITPRWQLTPGLRWEQGTSHMSGTISYYTTNPLPTAIKHNFLLAGISSQWVINKENQLYAGIAQAYRPVIFKDIIPASVYEEVNKNLKDASGYNAELGIRGKLFKYLQYDISLFSIQYNNRMGTLVLQNAQAQPYTYKTNIGNSRTTGIEVFAQYKFPINNSLYAGLFTSTAFMNARYTNASIADAGINKNITGNKVEAVPNCISRNGLEILYKTFTATLLYSYTASSFSDALNTYTPPASGAKGFTPAYSLWDFNCTIKLTNPIALRAGLNNIFNKQYFTKRPTFYPGPGIWPGDGRNFYATVSFKW